MYYQVMHRGLSGEWRMTGPATDSPHLAMNYLRQPGETFLLMDATERGVLNRWELVQRGQTVEGYSKANAITVLETELGVRPQDAGPGGDHDKRYVFTLSTNKMQVAALLRLNRQWYGSAEETR